MRSILSGIAIFLLLGSIASRARAGEWSVDVSGRHIERNGKPFFWLGDTAWLLLEKADRRDAETYLEARARQGFTVIQATLVMGEERVAGTLHANHYGDTAFIDGDPARPNITPGSDPKDSAAYDYWDNADYVIDLAEKKGLVMAVLPLFVAHSGDGFKYLTQKNAYAYGKFLGERYRKRHLIWILGGDHAPNADEHQPIWNLMARGITVGLAGTEDYRQTLMTFHSGNTSTEWWQTSPWLDFNMLQTWSKVPEIYSRLTSDCQKTPAKPCGLGEGAYEDGPQYPTRPINALAVRKQAYWSYFAGGYHTFGNTNVWNFGTFAPEATADWKRSLASPGARSLTVLRRFFESIPWWTLVPDPKVLTKKGQIGSGNGTNVALRAEDGSRAVVYVSGPDRVTLDLSRVTARRRLAATWIDPRSGARRAAAAPAAGAVEHTYVTPAGWEDALLMIVSGKAEVASP